MEIPKIKTPKILDNLLESLKGGVGGFSYKRLTALVSTITAIYITIIYTTPDNLSMILAIWLCFVALCIGMIEFKDIIQLRTGIISSTTQETVSSKKETVTTKSDESESPK